MKMGDAFASIGAVVDHDAEPLGEPKFFGHLAGDDEQVAEHRLVGLAGGLEADDFLLRNNQQMHRCLRLDVMDDDAAIVLMLDFGGNLAGDDALENCLGHG